MKKTVRLILSITPVNLFLASHLFLFLPASLFMESRRFWNYGFDAYLQILLPLAVIVYGLLSMPIIWLPFKWHKYYAVILTGVAAAIWGANFFVGSEGVVDGSSFYIEASVAQIYMNFFVITLLGLFFATLSYYKPKITNTLVIIASFLSFLTVIGLSVTEHKLGFLNYQESQKELATFSKQKNVLVILLDSFQSDFFQELLVKESSWETQFNGFTYYMNAASTAPATILSLPTIHSGEVYASGQDIDEFYKNNVKEHSFLKLLQNAGYRAMTLNPFMGFSPEGVARVNQNYISCRHFGVLCEARLLLNYSFFNSVPHLFKKYVYNEGSWLLSEFFLPTEIVSNRILSELATHVVTDSAVPTIKFLHLYGAHAPAVLDESCQLLHGAIWDRKSAVSQAQCAMRYVLEVLTALKWHQIYDKTAILILADHGAGLPATLNQTTLGAIANPLVLFKSFNETTPLRYSEARLSLIDIKQMVCEATNDCYTETNKSGLASTLQTRQRLPFNDYLRITEKQPVLRIYPYALEGSPREASSWVKLPPKNTLVHNINVLSDSFQDYAGTGWGKAEKHALYREVIGKQADLYLPLSQHNDVRIKFSVSTHPLNNHQIMSVLVNEHFVESFSITPEHYNHIAFTISKQMMTEKPTHITFQFSKWNGISDHDGNMPLTAVFYGTILVSSAVSVS